MVDELHKTPMNEPVSAPLGSSPSAKRRGLRALYGRLKGKTATDGDGLPKRVGRYEIRRVLGQGGMGIVYEARDERLGRSIALKMLSSIADDETGRKRFWREARAAASVNHPNVCQVYEIGDEAGALFIAMELLDGEPLSERLRRGPLSVSETLPIGLEVLAALGALHALGFVHRDLKPSNVHLTSHGVKLLDFGLTQPIDPEAAQTLGLDEKLTRTGFIVGTPRYMAPEHVVGKPLDARSDLFAAGAILFEMLAGRPAFEGRTALEILHATVNEQPPALTGSPAIAAADRVIRRALAKDPSQRPASAEAMAEELKAVQGVRGDNTRALARPLTRLVVLPFRVLRPDPDTDFLAFSVPDAIATSLSGIDSLVVRSSVTAARFDRDAPDLKAVAAEADVDLVVMGTLLRAGDELRASAQLVEAPAGTLIASHTVQASLSDLFRLQDDVARRVVEALSLPLSGRETRPTADTPRSARAYEFYLRANDLARKYNQLPMARDLYLQVVEEDPGFAPAWAQLGRCHLVVGKYIEDATGNYERSANAFHRALELSPNLSLAHRLYAHLQADMGQSQEAMVRLLGQAARRGNDPDLFAGLVHVCRYCGLYEQSIAAHEEARRLDPNVPTSVEQTFLEAAEFERLVSVAESDNPVRIIAMVFADRRDAAREALRKLDVSAAIPAYKLWVAMLSAWLERRNAEVLTQLTAMAEMQQLGIVKDPESLFMEGWMLCELGEHQVGLDRIRRGVAGGFWPAPTLARSPHFDALRGDPRFEALLEEANERRQQALVAFREAGGEGLLGS